MIDAPVRPILAGAVLSPGQGTPRDRRRARKAQPFPTVPDRAYDEPITRVKNLFGTFFLINDPVGIKRVLVDNVANYPRSGLSLRFFKALFGAGLLGIEGDLWRQHRRVMAPAFDPRSVATYMPAMAEVVEVFADRWAGFPADTKIDVAAEMTLLTLRIISRAMFSNDSEDVVDIVGRTTAAGLGEGSNINLLDVIPLVRGWRMNRRDARVSKTFAPLDEAVFRLIAERAVQGEHGGRDLLSRLATAADDDTGMTLTRQEARDEVVTIFIAGHETTAVSMDWIWYLLSQHPDVETALHAELARVLGGRTPTPEDFAELRYTRAVVDESMRLYPAAPGISSRRALEDDVICGLKVPRGAFVNVMPWVLHRHRGLWDDPEHFDPDRFMSERGGERHRFAYLPFSAGPRVCIGQGLAVNELMMILALLAQRFRLRLAPQTKVSLQYNITLRPRGGLPMILERRDGR